MILPVSTSVFFTVATPNELSQAIALGRSVLRHHPDDHFTLWLMASDEMPAVPAELQLRALSPAVSATEWAHLSLAYAPGDMGAIAVPRCFATHFAEGADRVVFLGPQTWLLAPLQAVDRVLSGGAVGLVTPHTLAPLLRDGHHPDDLDLLGVGVYQADFLALRRSDAADALLAWWWDWQCAEDTGAHRTGPSATPAWLNFAPLLWPEIQVLRHRGYNVGHWNLTQRQLAFSGQGWEAGGCPLVCFNFRDLDPLRPGQQVGRVSVEPNSPLALLLQQYRERLLAAGHDKPRRLPVRPVCFAAGPAVDPIARFAYRQARRDERRFASLLNSGPGSFYEWLRAPVPGERAGNQAISNYLFAAYCMREDVQRAYPDIFGAHRSGFLAWVRKKLVPELHASPEMLEAQLPTPPLAVNLAGYLRAKLGIAEAARGYALALRSQGIDIHYTDFSSETLSPLGDEALALSDANCSLQARHDINIIHVNADQLFEFERKVGRGYFAGRYNIGIWAWETPRFPREWLDRFGLLDEIWVGSSFMADAIAKVAPIPVVHVPHVVEVPQLAPDRAQFGLPGDEFLFLFFFDFNSTPTRKNPFGVVEAFRRAFDPQEPVRLVLKSLNGRNRPDVLEALRETAHGARITVIDEALDGLARYRLIASCDCFVSLHRAEGFGLGLAEAMALGRPVVATGWSGNMDFMHVGNSYPVRYRLAPLETPDPPYEAGTPWAVPDVDDATRLMRHVVTHRQEARDIGERARQDIVAGHSHEAIGGLMRERLALIDQRRREGQVPQSATGVVRRPVQTRLALFRLLRRAWRALLPRLPARYYGPAFRIANRIKRHFPVVR